MQDPELARTLLSVGLIFSALAALVSLFIMREAWFDLQAVRRMGILNGRRYIAKREMESEIVRTMAHGMFVLAIVAILIPSVSSMWGIITFVIGQVLLAADSVRALISRRKMLHQSKNYSAMRKKMKQERKDGDGDDL